MKYLVHTDKENEKIVEDTLRKMAKVGVCTVTWVAEIEVTSVQNFKSDVVPTKKSKRRFSGNRATHKLVWESIGGMSEVTNHQIHELMRDQGCSPSTVSHAMHGILVPKGKLKVIKKEDKTITFKVLNGLHHA